MSQKSLLLRLQAAADEYKRSAMSANAAMSKSDHADDAYIIAYTEHKLYTNTAKRLQALIDEYNERLVLTSA